MKVAFAHMSMIPVKARPAGQAAPVEAAAATKGDKKTSYTMDHAGSVRERAR